MDMIASDQERQLRTASLLIWAFTEEQPDRLVRMAHISGKAEPPHEACTGLGYSGDLNLQAHCTRRCTAACKFSVLLLRSQRLVQLGLATITTKNSLA